MIARANSAPPRSTTMGCLVVIKWVTILFIFIIFTLGAPKLRAGTGSLKLIHGTKDDYLDYTGPWRFPSSLGSTLISTYDIREDRIVVRSYYVLTLDDSATTWSYLPISQLVASKKYKIYVDIGSSAKLLGELQGNKLTLIDPNANKN